MRVLIVVAHLIACLFATQRAFCQSTHNVPGTFPTIMAAMAAAANGDTIVVAPGTYVGQFSFLGKAVRLVGSGGATVTILDGGNVGSVMSFLSAEGPASILEGFTLRNGRGPVGRGGGIHCLGASPTIRDCRIELNLGGAPGAPATPGAAGGIHCSSSSALIERCTIANNQGGAAFCSPFAPPCAGSAPSGGAGGVHCIGGSVTVIDSTISSNTGGFGGSGFSTAGAGGAGGLHVTSGTMTVRRCNISNNIGRGGIFNHAAGGGVHARSATVLVTESVITGNTGGGGAAATAELGNGGAGGVQGVFSTTTVVNCVISGNTGGPSGGVSGATAYSGGAGGVGSVGSNFAQVRHCTVTQNVGGAATIVPGGTSFVGPGGGRDVTIHNSIFWNNAGAEFSSGLANYSLIDGGVPLGVGNIDADPMFVAAPNDVRLTAFSPCIDAADPMLTPLPATDIEGEPRSFYHAPDMGADEYVAACWRGTVGLSQGTPTPLLSVNGSTSLVVQSTVGSPLTIGIAQPPLNTQQAPFLIVGQIGVPFHFLTTPLPGSVGELCLDYNDPGFFVLTVSYFPYPLELVPSVPAPWSITFFTGVPFPIDVAFQAIIPEQPAVDRVTNGVLLRIM